MTDDEEIPFQVTRDCPECGTEIRVRWPPDNPDAVTLKCHMPDCRTEMAVERDADK